MNKLFSKLESDKKMDAAKENITLIIGGDVCPMGRVEEYFCSGDAVNIFHDLLDDLKNSDLTVVNLESPLITKSNPILKSGPALSAQTGCVKGLFQSGIQVVSLANNHIFDHGCEGLLTTIDKCNEVGISCVGAGKNLEEAQRPLIREIKGKRIGFYAVAEHEFSIARPFAAGANPLDMMDYVHMLQSYRGTFDYLIVLYHGGVEYYPYPTPNMMKRCRFMIEMGASAVICSHSHCVSPFEIYKNCPIIYGQGNFIFESLSCHTLPTWYEGYLVKLLISEKGSLSFEIIPYEQSRGFVGAKKMVGEKKEEFLRSMELKVEEIQNHDIMEMKWRQYCDSNSYSYLRCLFGYNRVWARLNKYKIFSSLFHSQYSTLCAFIMVQCESPREVLETLLDEYLKKRH